MELTNLLIVDDDPSMRMLLQIALENEEGIGGVKVFTNGYDAVEAARTYDPDVLIVDSLLPGMTGEEVARSVRGLHPDVKVVSFSGLDGLFEWADVQIPKGNVHALDLLRDAVGPLVS